MRSTLTRAALLVSAGLVASTLGLGGAVAANAVSVPTPTPTPTLASVAVPTVTSSSSTASAQAEVTLTADGFQPNEALTVTLDSSPAETYAAPGSTKDMADGSGHYAASAYIPSTVAVGTHTFTVTGATSGPATTSITIVPQPTASVTPSTVTLSAYLSTGITATFTGFTPGDTVSFGLGDQGTGGPVGSPVVVGANGIVSVHYMPTAGAHYSTVGTYYFSAFSAGIVAQTATLTVVADPAAASPAAGAPVAAPATPVKQTASFTG